MPEPSDPLERRHTETAQNAEAEGASALDGDDAEGTRILKIVVAMVILMFFIAVAGLILIAR